MAQELQADDMPRTDEDWKNYVAQSFRNGTERMNKLEAGINANTTEIQKNTKLTEELKADTRELLEVFRAVKGGFRVLGWFGIGAKWLGGVAAAATAIYGFGLLLWQILHGNLPSK